MQAFSVTGGNAPVSTAEFAQSDLNRHMTLDRYTLIGAVSSKSKNFRANIVKQQLDRGWEKAPACSLTKATDRGSAWHLDPRRAAGDLRSRIARVLIRIERLNARLESKGEHSTVQAMTRALNGDPSQLESLQEWESDLHEYMEFLAILGELQKIQELQQELAYEAASSQQSYQVQGVLTEPEFLKTPDQTLCGAVSIKAPPALPTDMTRTGYAVGCVA